MAWARMSCKADHAMVKACRLYCVYVRSGTSARQIPRPKEAIQEGRVYDRKHGKWLSCMRKHCPPPFLSSHTTLYPTGQLLIPGPTISYVYTLNFVLRRTHTLTYHTVALQRSSKRVKSSQLDYSSCIALVPLC